MRLFVGSSDADQPGRAIFGRQRAAVASSAARSDAMHRRHEQVNDPLRGTSRTDRLPPRDSQKGSVLTPNARTASRAASRTARLAAQTRPRKRWLGCTGQRNTAPPDARWRKGPPTAAGRSAAGEVFASRRFHRPSHGALSSGRATDRRARGRGARRWSRPLFDSSTTAGACRRPCSGYAPPKSAIPARRQDIADG